MKKIIFIVLFFIAVLAQGQLLNTLFPPITVPSGGCPAGVELTNSFCALQHDVLPNRHGIVGQIVAQAVDTGSCVGTVCTSNFNFASSDAKYIMFTMGYAVTSVSTSAGVATAIMPALSSAPYGPDDWICNYGVSVGAYNGCKHLLSATYISSKLTQVTWTQGGAPASATGGFMAESCGANLAGGAARCRIELVIAHNTGTGPNQGLPSSGYPVSQAWANQACTLHTWIASAHHPINDCLWVPSVGHFYHATNLCATTGYCISGGTIPGSWNIAGGTTSDGTITWQDDGTTNALPLEVVTQTAGYPGIAGTPASAVFNINSVSCGGACSVAQVASGEPMVFEWPYIAWINAFNTNLVAHYASVAWASLIDYIRIGVIGGGEIFPYASTVIQANYSFDGPKMSNIYVDAAVQTYANSSAQWVSSGSPAFTLMASFNTYAGSCGTSCHLMPDGLAAAAVSLPGYNSIGSQGLQANDILNWPIEVGGSSTVVTSNVFIKQAMQYWPQLKWIEQQTVKDSAGPGSSGCSAQQILTGPLDVLMVFSTQHHTNVIESYNTDDFATYSPTYQLTVTTGFTTGSGCTPYPTGYDQSYLNASVGVPSSTSVQIGNSRMIGNAGSIQ